MFLNLFCHFPLFSSNILFQQQRKRILSDDLWNKSRGKFEETKKSRAQIPLETREHWFFLLDIGNSNSRSARGIFREQRKCSLVLNRVANYYRAKRVQRGSPRVSKEPREFNFPFSVATRNEISTLPPKIENPDFLCTETCVCASGRKRFLGLCNWVVACPDPDECRVTSAPLIFPSSSFVKVSINKRTQSFHHPHCWNLLDSSIIGGHAFYWIERWSYGNVWCVGPEGEMKGRREGFAPPGFYDSSSLFLKHGNSFLCEPVVCVPFSRTTAKPFHGARLL